MDLIGEMRRNINAHNMVGEGQVITLGVSGGPDSLAMLHALSQLAPEYEARLHVGHLDHGIRGAESAVDAAFVRDLCAAWGVPCTVALADVPALAEAQGLAIEEAARRARYRFLGDLARSLGSASVAVAHNADDQVETVLMHFLRGSGLAGLRGMRPVSRMEELRLGSEPREVRDIRLLRPLLTVPRHMVEAYCTEQGLQPRFDRSNLDCTYFRNSLRHELIPTLESYNPNIREVVRRMAEALAGDYGLLREMLRQTWPQVVRQETAQAIVYDLAAFRAQPVGMQRSLLREGVHRLRRSLRNINWVHIDDAVAIAAEGQTGAQATLPQGLLLTLGYDVMALSAADVEMPGEDRPRVRETLAVPIAGTIGLAEGGWTLATQVVARDILGDVWRTNKDPDVVYLDADQVGYHLSLRPRRPGDRFQPLGLGGHQSVRDYMINAKIPSSERDRVPLLVDGSDHIVWIVGHRLDEQYAIGPTTRRVLVVHVTKGADQDG